MVDNLIIFCVYFVIKATYLCISIIPSAENRFMFNMWSLLTIKYLESLSEPNFTISMSLKIEDHITASESMRVGQE